jgi:hypothetical protein
LHCRYLDLFNVHCFCLYVNKIPQKSSESLFPCRSREGSRQGGQMSLWKIAQNEV